MRRRRSAGAGPIAPARRRVGSLAVGVESRDARDGGRRLKIVIAARPALVCECLSLALESDSSLAVAGQARDEDEARRLVM